MLKSAPNLTPEKAKQIAFNVKKCIQDSTDKIMTELAIKKGAADNVRVITNYKDTYERPI